MAENMKIYEKNDKGLWVWTDHTCKQYDEDDFDPDTNLEWAVQWVIWSFKAALGVSMQWP